MKCYEIRDFCGDYALDIKFPYGEVFTLYFNSRRNAEIVKRCLDVDASVPNVTTVADFVEVVRCKDCKHFEIDDEGFTYCFASTGLDGKLPDDYCSCGIRREENEG